MPSTVEPGTSLSHHCVIAPITLLAVIAFGALGAAGASAADFSEAPSIFVRFAKVCESEGGALWGESLCGPILFVDPATRAVAANVQDGGKVLRDAGGMFVGTLPSTVTVANTGVDWSGTRWTMVMWPLPQSEASRLVLVAHESFHRIQPALGFNGNDGDNGHLDSMEGRMWLLLEARALACALAAGGDGRRTAVADALRFRAKRYALIPGAAANESALEANEGLAEYTGVAVGAPAAGVAAAERARQTLENLVKRASLVRSFAYATGPAYGVLLDEAEIRWRERALRGATFPALAAEAFGIEAIDPADAAARAAEYGGDEVAAAERARDEERRARLGRFRAALVDGPVVVIPLGDGKTMFDPNRVYPFGEHGTVYGTFNATGPWGELSSSEMALVSADWKELRLAGPPRVEDETIAGDGWTLKLVRGWTLAPGGREGDRVVAAAEQ